MSLLGKQSIALNRRASGVLAHITSLPGPYGVGDLGPAARGFADFLAAAKQRYWQVLPVHPTQGGTGHSPYSSNSAWAGNPLLLSPEDLCSQGLVDRDEIQAGLQRDHESDFDQALRFKMGLCAKVQARLAKGQLPRMALGLRSFYQANRGWLEDYALFAAAKEYFGLSCPWRKWPKGLRLRRPDDLAWWRRELHQAVELHGIGQYLFFVQWQRLKGYCHQQGVFLIGDVPIYVDLESADVWSHPECFKLDQDLRPRVLAGVPPDYFSSTGQLWANPVYAWDRLRLDGYQWWLGRIQAELQLCDLLRLDHFRGLVACWEVPAGEKTAENGTWSEVPGEEFLSRLKGNLGGLPLIAEDLGYITEDVRQLKRRFGLPGMALLVFAFDADPNNPFLPCNQERDLVVYTGTHDTNTVRGWFEEEADQRQTGCLADYLGHEVSKETVSRELVSLALEAPANTAILPLQDLLGLSGWARMNDPGEARGNWAWRFKDQDLGPGLSGWLRDQTLLAGRA